MIESRKETGVVFRSTGSWYDVQDSSSLTIKCNLKGRIRLEGLRSTNPIAVGDSVVFTRSSDGTGIIEKIEERIMGTVLRLIFGFEGIPQLKKPIIQSCFSLERFL